MAASPSNSGFLRVIGDVVTLERDPSHDAVGVQVHGDADGVELVFEGAMAGSYHPLAAKALSETIPLQRDGRYSHIVPALHCKRVRVKLVGLKAGSLAVALYSGNAEQMEAMMKLQPAEKIKPVKLMKAKEAPAKEQAPKEPVADKSAPAVDKEPAKEPVKETPKVETKAPAKETKEPSGRTGR